MQKKSAERGWRHSVPGLIGGVVKFPLSAEYDVPLKREKRAKGEEGSRKKRDWG